MRNLDQEFKNKHIEYEKLLKYGFVERNKSYFFETKICDDLFIVNIEISKEKQISKVIDLSLNEEYVLVDVKDSFGSFVGKIKEEYENILNDILETCTTPNIFRSKQAREIIRYVKEKYNDELEYLWKKFPNNAVWRNKVNQRWYGALLVLAENKLGIESDKIIDILDLRFQKEMIKEFIDNEKVFAGYHMNKDNWITIKLDNGVDIKDIYRLIDNSYELSLKK